MGVDTHKPLLPAPTDSSTLDTGGSVTGTDLATDLSRQTDKTSYSIPDDGRPITISTQKRHHRGKDDGKLTKSSHHSQTSLLIEYFEGGKSGPNLESRPSVRVKVTPSAARKIKDQHDHIQITEAGGTRRPSYSRRISLGKSGGPKGEGDDRSVSSYTSAAEDSNVAHRGPPVEIEVLHKDQESDLSGTNLSRDARYIQPTSDISSMPPDSMLDMNTAPTEPRRERSRSLTRGDDVIATKDTLKTPSRRRSRSLSRERLAHKVVEKLSSKPREVSSGKNRREEQSRSRSASKELLEADLKSPRRRSGKHHREESLTSGAESSLLTNSALSPKRKSGDQYSFRSGTSKSSINNPKLLETVEDAIRRLILPELKELKKDQKVQQNRNKFDRDANSSLVSGSSVSRDEITRRVSKHSSLPDVGKPKVVLDRDGKSPVVLSGDSTKRRKERRRDRELDSPSERSYDRRTSEDTTVEDEKGHRKRGKGDRLKDAGTGALVGGILTAAALKHHDSKSSIDRRERRKKRSKSRSRSESLAESEEIFHKHDIPPMPMRSDVDSELTRDSILSQRTATPQRTEFREVLRGSPREIQSPASTTPTRTPLGLQKGLGTHHSNLSNRDLSIHSAESDRSPRDVHDDSHHSLHHSAHNSNLAKAGLAGAAAGVGVLAAGHLLDRHDRDYDAEEHHAYAPESRYHHPRALSPIQSVASGREEYSEHANRDSMRYPHSAGSLESMEKGARVMDRQLSIDSLSSAPSTDFARSKRPGGINLEKPRDILGQHEGHGADLGYEESPRQSPRQSARDMDQWYDEQHQENEKYRHLDDDSLNDPRIDVRHMTNYTDDSLDAPYLDKVTAGQAVTRGFGANPEYVHTPVAVESAVASLHEPSILDVNSLRSGNRSYSDSLNQRHVDSPRSFDGATRDLSVRDEGSPLKQRHDASDLAEKSFQQRAGATSPPQSVTQSLEEREMHPELGASGLPVAEDPIPEIGHGLDSEESEINTNPSIIQGPIGGTIHENRDHWPYNETPPRSKGNLLPPHSNHSSKHGLSTTEAALAGGALGAGLGAAATGHDRDLGKDYQKPTGQYGDEEGINHDLGPIKDIYMSSQPIPTPPGIKDEGYISAANPRSPGALTPESRNKGLGALDNNGIGDIVNETGADDPFTGTTHNRHLSGYSHGMPSPLYDSATGRGIDRIQSKDIVALMDHLTVRDAQRNARDTEILVTLVRSAAEMRNSFEDMKKFIVEQDDLIMDTSDRQHEKTQKAIGGPRPQPLGTPRFPRRPSAEEEDLPTKRKNVFKRALRGLSMKNSNDLGKIEDMLMHLLDEVEGLRIGQNGQPRGNGTQPASLNSADNLRGVVQDAGYEPEGQAGTSSTGDQSGYFSNNSSRPAADRGFTGRRGSENRISTVLEGDEELDPHEQTILDHHDGQQTNEPELRTPTRELRAERRSDSVPLTTPPRVNVPTGAHSNENTPRISSDGKTRKHKSSSSSFFPKISRWSKTTASSVGENFRNSIQPGRKERPFSEASRSGSNLEEGNYNTYDSYDRHGDDKLPEDDYWLENDPQLEDESNLNNRPPSPLIPSQVSSNQPKYQAHRNSLNLQHPQPRQGPTGRYQSQLESQAQNFGSPISPSSDQWGSNPNLPPQNVSRHSGGGAGGHLSPISDTGYSETSSAAAPPRPPKIKDEGPLVPQRPPKISLKDASNDNTGPTYADHVAARGGNVGEFQKANGSPIRSSSGQLLVPSPQRKPTGPRPITSSGQYSPEKTPGGVLADVKKHRYRGSPNHIEGSSAEDVTF